MTTREDFIKANSNQENINFYLNEYPFLQNENPWPPETEKLKEFYFRVMEQGNNEPVPQLYNDYESLFSFYLANKNKINPDILGRDWFEKFGVAIEKGLGKTWNDAGQVINNLFPWFKIALLTAAVIAAIILINKIK